jgi:type II secretory pathway component PulK
MEILTNVGMALVLLSVITVIVSAMMTRYSEKSYLRLKRRQQRDRADRHITMLEVQIKNLEDRVLHLETKYVQ